MTRPHLVVIIGITLLGAFVTLISPEFARTSIWLSMAILSCGIVFFCYGAWLIIMRERYEKLMEADEYTVIRLKENQEFQTLLLISRLQEYQADLIKNQIVRLTYKAGIRNPIKSVELTGLIPAPVIPLAFVTEVLKNSTEEYFAPQRDFPTVKRDWYNSIVEWCQFYNLIEKPASGNVSIQWRPGGYNTACAAFALAKDEQEE